MLVAAMVEGMIRGAAVDWQGAGGEVEGSKPNVYSIASHPFAQNAYSTRSQALLRAARPDPSLRKKTLVQDDNHSR